ncbi:MAG: DUF2849 domain-containing protein [Pseudomonadota bacterium]
MTPQVLTANHLALGDVVFLTIDETWDADIAKARVATDSDQAKALEVIGAQDVDRNLIVEPYLIDVEDREGKPVPLRNRERIRAQGPTTHAAFQR